MDRAVGGIVNHPPVLIHRGVRLVHGRGDDRRIFRPYGHAYFQFKRRIAVIVLNKEKRGIGNDTRIFRKQLFLDGERSVRIGEIFRGNVDDLAVAVLHGERNIALRLHFHRNIDRSRSVYTGSGLFCQNRSIDTGNLNLCDIVNADQPDIRLFTAEHIVRENEICQNIFRFPCCLTFGNIAVKLQIRFPCGFAELNGNRRLGGRGGVYDGLYGRSAFMHLPFTAVLQRLRDNADYRTAGIITKSGSVMCPTFCRLFIYEGNPHITGADTDIRNIDGKRNFFSCRQYVVNIVEIVSRAAGYLTQRRKASVDFMQCRMTIINEIGPPAVFIRVRQVDRRVFRPCGSAVVRREDRSHGKAHRHNDGKQDQPNFLCSCHKTSSLFL